MKPQLGRKLQKSKAVAAVFEESVPPAPGAIRLFRRQERSPDPSATTESEPQLGPDEQSEALDFPFNRLMQQKPARAERAAYAERRYQTHTRVRGTGHYVSLRSGPLSYIGDYTAMLPHCVQWYAGRWCVPRHGPVEGQRCSPARETGRCVQNRVEVTRAGK